jgi:ABC-2 type transport system ATP-binding protein
MNAVEIENVTKGFGKHVAVDDLSLEVPQGCIFGLIGPNGSGKTTTMRMIMNILYPDKGMIRVFGEELVGACTDRIGYMPEERGLYKKMKVREILRFHGAMKNGQDVRQEVDRWLEKLDLKAWANKKVEALSKGMSQKVQFIATVVSRPELVILDEPLTGLDPVNADMIASAVLDLARDGTTVILSTHDMGLAERMCDWILMICQGRKVLDGTLESIQDVYGNDTIRIRTENGSRGMEEFAGVENVSNLGNVQELQIGNDRDPQQIVTEIMAQTRLRSFEIAKPSLHDIFVRIAGPQAEEVGNA